MLHPIGGMKARKRKATPSVIDLTCPTQKRSRSASGDDIINVDGDTEVSQSTVVGEEGKPGRSPSVELQDERSLPKGDIVKGVLNWSRLSMKQMRSARLKQSVEYQLILFLQEEG